MGTTDSKQLTKIGLGHGARHLPNPLHVILGQFDVLAATEIFRLWNGVKMIGIDALSIAAQVVQLHPFRDRASVPLVDKAMGLNVSPVGVPLAVATTVTSALPNPAARVGINNVFGRGLAAVVSGEEVSGLTSLDATEFIRARGNRGLFAATAPARAWLYSIRRGGDDNLWTRHSLTSSTGRGIRRSPDGYRRAGVFACQF